MNKLKQIKTHIQNNKTLAALSVAEEYLQEFDEDLLNELTVIRGSWQHSKDSYESSRISDEVWGQVLAKTNYAVLSLVEKINNPVQSMREKVVLFLCSNPNGRYDLEFEEEVDRIREALEKGSNKEKFGIVVESNTTIDDFEALLEKYRPYALHICVSSLRNEGEGMMLFEGGNNMEVEIGHSTVENRLNEMKQSGIILPEVIFFDTCFSYKYGLIAIKYVNYVIAMKDFISNDFSHLLSKSFYGNLFNAKTIEQSFSRALESIESSVQLNKQNNIGMNLKEIPVLLTKQK